MSQAHREEDPHDCQRTLPAQLGAALRGGLAGEEEQGM